MNSSLVGAAKSKTIWVAVALAVLSALEPQLGLLKDLVDPKTVQVVGLIMSTIMIVLRTLTTESLADKGAPPAPTTQDAAK
jgi:hypothetical protein